MIILGWIFLIVGVIALLTLIVWAGRDENRRRREIVAKIRARGPIVRSLKNPD